MSDKSKMETCTCMISLSGGASGSKGVVERQGITVAEAVVLNIIHGEGAVQDVVLGSVIKDFSHTEEKSRLVEKYDKYVKKPVEGAFPGISPRMPLKFKEVNIEAAFASKVKKQHGNVVPVRGGKPDVVTDAEREEIANDTSTVTKTV